MVADAVAPVLRGPGSLALWKLLSAAPPSWRSQIILAHLTVLFLQRPVGIMSLTLLH